MNQVKRIIGILLALVMLCSMIPVAFAETTKFADFPTGWSKEAMTAAVNNGLLNGYEDGKIHPEANLTRAQFAAIMVRAFGAKTKANISDFRDVPVSAWYYEDIARAVKMGALKGQSASEMAPDSPITRQEAFTAFARILVLSNEDASALNKFNDKGEIASWAINHIAALTERGYVNGDPEGNVNPGALISREEFAQIMHNSIRTYITEPGVYTEDLEGITVIRVGSVTLKGLTNTSDLVIGDGVGNGTIQIENVTIGKRLLVRGAGVVKVIKSTLGDYVVVNNVNGVTKFENYRSESFFKGIVENTKAEFKKHYSGGSSDDSVTVTFYKHFGTIDDWYMGEVEIEKGGKVDKDNFPAISDDDIYRGYDENSDVASVYDKEWTHTITPKFWYVKDNVITRFDENVEVDEDINVYLMSKSLSLMIQIEGIKQPIQVSANYDANTRVMDSVKDMLAKSGKDQLDLALATNMIPNYNKTMDKVVDKMVATGIIKLDGNKKNVQVIDVPIKISTLIKEETIHQMVRDLIRESVKTPSGFDELYSHLDITANAHELDIGHIISGMTDYQIKSYVNGLTPNEKQNFADKLFEVIKDDDNYKYFVNSLMKKDSFEINKSNVSEIAIIKKAIKELTLEEALAESNNSALDKLVDAIGIDELRPYYVEMRDDYCDGLEIAINDVIASTDANIKKSYTTSLTYKLNIFDIYEKVYDKAKDKVIEKLQNAGIYDSRNRYLTFLVEEQNIVEYLFDGDSSLADGDFTGYSLRDIMDYYDYMMMLLIVGDDALTWYGDTISEEQIAALYDAMFDKMFFVHEKVNEILEAFKNDGQLPSKIQGAVESIDKLNNLILQYGDKAKTLISKYFDGDINIDSIYVLLYNYDDTIQEKLKAVVETDKFKQAIDKFESTSIGELFKGDGQNSLYNMFYTLAYEGIDAFKVPAGELKVTDIDVYKISVGKITMTVQRSYR